MTEDQAKDWVRARVSAPAMEHLLAFATWVAEENAHQNLISPATVPIMWQRHIVDSLQLYDLAGGRTGAWLDIGSGGGFPGMVLAIAGATPMLMVEPRKRRVAFLRDSIARLGLNGTTVAEAKVERIETQAEVITARAVASVEKLLHAAQHCCTSTTRWLLPRGSAPAGDLATMLAPFKVVFHVEQSLTEPTSTILVIDGRPA